jgi:hypothetical protein
MKLPVFWEYAECIPKFEYLVEFEANTLDGQSGALMGSFGQTSLKWKISCMCTFYDGRHLHLEDLLVILVNDIYRKLLKEAFAIR